MVGSLAALEASARTPEALPAYVAAVSGLKATPCGDGILHYGDGFGVLAVFPETSRIQKVVDDSVEAAINGFRLDNLTVLAPCRPAQAPAEAAMEEDVYWSLATGAPLPAKTRNMIKRAKRETRISKASGKCWTEAHGELVAQFCRRKKNAISDATLHIFSRLGEYLKAAPHAALFSAHNGVDELTACAIGDFTSFTTAFYMFAFRSSNAAPGTADLLLSEVAESAREHGQTRINLGLGINDGVGFFKKKWGASPWIDYVETSWTIRRKSWLGRLFGKGANG